MKTIVALVDFSDVTPEVVKHAEILAKAFQSRVILMHIVRSAPFGDEFGATMPAIVEVDENFLRAHQVKLLALQEPLSKAGITVTNQQLLDAGVEEVLNECSRLEADLIIVGSHHHGTLYNLLIGSLSQDLLKRLSCPVLVVPAHVPAA
jgi:nucleotide-binding universal stress UspA family protein